jgi:hypothetical protein
MSHAVRAIRTFVSRHPVGVIVVLSALFMACLALAYGVGRYTNDTMSYYSAWNVLCNEGCVDAIRTPIYPIVLGVIGHWSDTAVVLFQCAVFLLSIKYFWRVSCALIPSKRWAMVALVLYGLNPGVFTFNFIILTESLAVSGLVVFIYAAMKVMESPRVWRFVVMLVLLLTLLMLRPAFIYLTVVMLGLAVISIARRQKRQAVYMVASMVISTAMLLGYAGLVEKKCGVYTVSGVTVWNDLRIALSEKYTEGMVADNPKFQVAVDECTGAYASDWVKYSVFDTMNVSLRETADFIAQAKAHGGVITIIRGAVGRVIRVVGDPMFTVDYYQSIPVITHVTETLHYGDAYIVLVLYAILTLCAYRRRHQRLSALGVLLWLTCVGHILVSTYGSYGEWTRLFLPCAPLIVLLASHILSSVRSVELSEPQQ